MNMQAYTNQQQNKPKLPKYFWIVFSVVVAIFLAINAALFIQTKTATQQKAQPQPASQTLTNKLLEANNKYNKASGKEKEQKLQDMIVLAKQREAELKKLIEASPEAVLQQAIPSQQTDQLPPQVQQQVEKHVRLTGRFTEVEIHKTDSDGSIIKKYFLEIPNGTIVNVYYLYLTKKYKDLSSGQTVTVSGIILGKDIAVDTIEQQVKGVRSSDPPVTEARVAVIPIKFLNTPNNHRSIAEIDSFVFSGENSVKENLEEYSYNQFLYSGRVFDWVTLPITISSSTLCSYMEWSNQADSIIGNTVLNNYTQKIYFFPSDQDFWSICSNSLLVSDSFSRAWLSWLYKDATTQESAHSLALGHNSSILCNDKSIDEYPNCAHSEYGNIFSSMGSGFPGHFNAPYKAALGWIPASRIQTVTSDGTYTIANLETQASSIQVVKIPKNDTREYYYVEYRNLTGKDSFSTDRFIFVKPFVRPGVQINIWNEDPIYPTRLIDISPKSIINPFVGIEADLFDASFFDGGIFYDQINKISIKQLSHTTTSATVEIKFNPTDIKLSPCNNLGNVDEDAVISSLDINWLSAYIQENRQFNTEQVRRAKLNSDGIVNNEDLQLLQNYLNGTIDTFPACPVASIPLLNNWADLASSAFPQPIAGHDAVYHNGFIFVGIESPTVGIQPPIYSARVNNPTNLGPWNQLSSQGLPTFLEKYRMVTSKGYLFIVGGNNFSGKSASVYSAKINSDGTINSWQTLASLPDGNYYFELLVVNDYLFLIGGYDSFGPINKLYSAQINNNGTVGAWNTFTIPELPAIINEAAMYKDGYIYIIGGNIGTLTDWVWVCSVTTDHINDCTPQNIPHLPRTLFRHKALLLGNNLFIIGGESTPGIDNANAEVFSTTISAGTVAPWIVDKELPMALTNFTAVSTGNTIFTLGGDSNTGPVAKIYSTQLTSEILLPSSTPTSLPSPTPSATQVRVNFGVIPASSPNTTSQ